MVKLVSTLIRLRDAFDFKKARFLKTDKFVISHIRTTESAAAALSSVLLATLAQAFNSANGTAFNLAGTACQVMWGTAAILNTSPEGPYANVGNGYFSTWIAMLSAW